MIEFSFLGELNESNKIFIEIEMARREDGQTDYCFSLLIDDDS